MLQATYLRYKRSDGVIVKEPRLTIGVGHYCHEGEINDETGKAFKEGDRICIHYANALFERDIQPCIVAAENQAWLLDIDNHDFKEALVSVNFQLGINWHKTFKNTWGYLQAKQWEAAAQEVEKSLWFKQTPIRVRDFQQAIRKLKETI